MVIKKFDVEISSNSPPQWVDELDLEIYWVLLKNWPPTPEKFLLSVERLLRGATVKCNGLVAKYAWNNEEKSQKISRTTQKLQATISSKNLTIQHFTKWTYWVVFIHKPSEGLVNFVSSCSEHEWATNHPKQGRELSFIQMNTKWLLMTSNCSLKVDKFQITLIQIVSDHLLLMGPKSLWSFLLTLICLFMSGNLKKLLLRR